VDTVPEGVLLLDATGQIAMANPAAERALFVLGDAQVGDRLTRLGDRSLAGLVIQEQFAAFAANFVRWAAAWLYEMCPDAPAPFSRVPLKVEQMVRIAANTSAWVIGQPQSWLLTFTELSASPDVELVIRDSAPLQLALPFFEELRFSHF
jgi:PAS domain-containing protein